MTTTVAPAAVVMSAAALSLRWNDVELALPAALLRARCRCAGCVAASRHAELAVTDAAIELVDAIPVGHYAVQLRFSDGHERGIYPWQYLRELGLRAS